MRALFPDSGPRTSSVARVVLAAVALVMSSACAAPSHTGVWLVVDTNLRDSDGDLEFDEIEIEVDGRAIGADRETRRVRVERDTELPLTLAITHERGALGPIVVRTRSRGGVEVEQYATVHLTAGTFRELRMELTRSCVDLRCEPEQTCRAGRCEAREIELGTSLAALGPPSDAGVGAGACEADCGVADRDITRD